MCSDHICTILQWATLLRQRLKPMLLYNREKFEGHTTRLFRSGFPLLNRRFTGIEVTGEDRLAHAKTLAWKINEMTSTERPSVNLYEPRDVSREGFRIENAAGVALENCLNEGVHLKTLWGLLWVDWLKIVGNRG